MWEEQDQLDCTYSTPCARLRERLKGNGRIALATLK
jgi:hypothetical protein